MTALNHDLDDIPLSVFFEIDAKLAACGRPRVMPLHQGKTTFNAAVSMRDWETSEFDLLAHQHAPPSGIAALRRKAAEHHARTFGRDVTEDQIIISAGATHAISSVLGAIIDRGDEVLVLSPQWLFAVGLVAASGGVPVEVPVFLELSNDAAFDYIGAIRSHITRRTRAIYFNTPNNPTGFSLDDAQLVALAALAAENDWWVIADNAYEIYEFGSREFLDIGKLDADRTFSVHSFSKTFAMPGHRIAYSVVPARAVTTLRKRGLYSVYSIATPSQFTAFQALGIYDEVALRHNQCAAIARDLLERTLTVPHTSVAGGLYTLLDLTRWGATDLFIDRCIARGVSLAPGRAFGARCSDHARLCFTAVNSGDLEQAILEINRVYAGAV